MFGRSHTLGGLVTVIAVAVSVAAFAVPASATSRSCAPPAGADGWYCAALALSNPGVTERLVDDSFRDAAAVPAQTSEGFVDDSWRSHSMTATAGSCTPPVEADGWYCAALALNNADVTGRLVDDYATPASAPTSEGFVDDSWRSPSVADAAQAGSGGFAWDDFGIGVAVAVGAILLAMGVASRLRGHRRLGVGGA